MDVDNKKRIDCVIDAMNTLRFLCQTDVSSREKLMVMTDSNSNDIMVYYTPFFKELLQALDREPEISPIDFEADTDNKYKATAYYRGARLFCYITEEELPILKGMIEKHRAKEEEEAND